MLEIKKYIINGMIGLGFAALTWWISTVWEATKINTEYSIKYTESFKTINIKLNQLEKNIDKMPDTYVTRRELDIRLQNIDTKIGNLNQEVRSIGNNVKDVNNKFDRLLEKIYEK